MAHLWNRDWTRRELEQFAPLDQVAGFTRSHLTDGFERGVESIAVRTGSGLRFGICPSRGLDLTFAEWNGLPLAWRGLHGNAHPAYYSESNFGWLRGFSGLLATCGLGSFGPPCEDQGELYGLHDRISYTPAREVAARTVWEDERTCAFRVQGTLRQGRIFGDNLRLERTIEARLGESRIRLRDELVNDGFESAPAVILYHCNFGFPLLDEGSQVMLNAKATRPRTPVAERGLGTWNQVERPRPGYDEQVFFHDLEPDANGIASAMLWNEKLSLGVRLQFPAVQLPHFTQWKMLGAGAYAMGLEPSSAPLVTRAELRQQGALPMLEPGESRRFELELEVVTSL